jgi:hypothetical protein
MTKTELTEQILNEFCDDIESTGGLTDHDGESVGVVADPAWFDLAVTYVRACHALGREPMTHNVDPPVDSQEFIDRALAGRPGD